MTVAPAQTWCDLNQRYLSAALAEVREALERHVGGSSREDAVDIQSGAGRSDLRQIAGTMSTPPAVVTLCKTMRLSPFERDILLLCAGMEFDAVFADLCAAAAGAPERRYPTFSLALAALRQPHWSALSPAAPLRHWRLIEAEAGRPLTLSPLRIDERVLHHLAGVQHVDERLFGIVEPAPARGELTPSQQALVEKVCTVWSRAGEATECPVIQLLGADWEAKRAVAARAAADSGLNLLAIAESALPHSTGELAGLVRLWEREAALSSAALFLDSEDAETADSAPQDAALRFIERTHGPVLWACAQPRHARQRSVISVDVRKPTTGEQQRLWNTILNTTPAEVNGEVDRLVSQFDLSSSTIRAACGEAARELATARDPSSGPSGDSASRLWEACRAQTRTGMDDLARRIEPAATWNDIVVPKSQMRVLREIAIHVRQRAKVYDRWGFAAKCARGLAISALFVGPSGTGKTLAAEIIGRELHLDVFMIDLASVLSRWLGGTEKRLRRLFDTAEESGAILLFDEADALFGKRGEVKDSHDRYANIEINYLLQRMESYRGLAVLTTNMKSAIDAAFLRRIRFIVHFPFPDADLRAEIWRRIFPAQTPVENLDYGKLARLNVPGGSIRNIALRAAFLAADRDEPVRMTHMVSAARMEFAKVEKSLTDADVGDWVRDA